MARSSILGGDEAPERSGSFDQAPLGPSDSSDSGSDVYGTPDMTAGDDMPLNDGPLDLDRTSTTRGPVGAGSDSDSAGTGERLGAEPNSGIDEGGDIAPDRIIGDLDADLTGDPLSADDLQELMADDGDDEDEGDADDVA